MMSKEAAQAAVDAIKVALGNMEQHVTDLIEGQGWKALGHDTFVDMWTTEFKGFRLATGPMQAQAVFAVFAESRMPDEEIVRHLGVADQVVRTLRSKWVAGVRDPNIVSTRVPSYDRSATRAEAQVARAPLTPDEYRDFKAIAEAHGWNFEQANAGALRDFYRRAESFNARTA